MVQNQEKIYFGPIKSSVFSTAQAEESLWKKLEKQDWWFGGLMSQTGHLFGDSFDD